MWLPLCFAGWHRHPPHPGSPSSPLALVACPPVAQQQPAEHGGSQEKVEGLQ